MEFPLLRDLGLLIVGAALFGLAARAVRLPAIIGYILAGLVLGPLAGIRPVSESTELIAQIGIALLLFLAGMGMSLEAIRGVGRSAVTGGAIQSVVTSIIATAAALALGHAFVTALILGVCVAFTSTVVTIKLLDQSRELNSTHGRLAVGILLTDDMFAVVILTLMAGLEGGAGADLGGVARGLLTAAGGMIGLAVTAFLAGRYLLPRLFRWIAITADAVFIWALTWCFLFILLAQTLGLSVEVGAFIAGLSMAELPIAHDLRRRVQPLASFFLAVFFVSLGVGMAPGAAVEYWPTVLVLGLIAVIEKPLLIRFVLPRLGYDVATSTSTAFFLGQTSEFSFVVAALAIGTGFLAPELLSPIGVMTILTMGWTTFVVSRKDRLIERLAPREVTPAAPAAEGERGHVIVVGMNALGRRIVGALLDAGERVVAVDTDAEKLERLPCPTVVGSADHPDVLRDASFERARLLVSALQIEETNNLIAFRCRRAGLASSIHAFDPSLVNELREYGATHVIVSKADGTRQLADELRRAGVID